MEETLRPRSLFISLIATLALGLIISGAARSQESIPTTEEEVPDAGESIEALKARGIELFTNERLDEALTVFQAIIDRHKDDPKGYFCKAAAYGVTMKAYRTLAFEREFSHYVELAIAKAEARLKMNHDDAEAQFYLGGAYGYRGISKIMVGNWFGAFLDGTRGVFHLRKAVAINPNYYDAYYGIGTYHYWVSAKGGILWFLPFFSDERARGIEEIRLAGAKGRLARHEAKASLVNVLINEGRWDEALGAVEDLNAEYPNFLSSRIKRGVVMAELGRWPEVEQDFQWVKGLLATRPFHGYMRMLEANYYLALATHRQKRSRLFSEHCLQVRELMGRHRSRRYFEGLAELEHRARRLCGAPVPLSAKQ